MIDGICPRCAAETVYIAKLGGDEGKMNLVVQQNDRIFSMNIAIFKVQTYVCGSCGYLELRSQMTNSSGAVLGEALAASESKDCQRVPVRRRG